jgi:thiosulfate/3-mercaptopyruvate sulfurtransferase
MTRLPLILEAEQLERNLNDTTLLIVDLRSRDHYLTGHIPGAVQLNYADILRADPPALGLLPDIAHLRTVLSTLGVTASTSVVAYDDEGGGYASRLLWTLDLLDHQRLSLLNGGIRAWIAEARPLEQKAVLPKPAPYQARLANPGVLADKDYILSRLGQTDLILLDSRSPAEFQGYDKRAARGGHIPGAVNLNWTLTMDERRHLRLKPDATLHGLLEAIGVTPEKEVIVYCQTHHRSAHSYFVLKHLGYPRIRGYAGGWSEWGNDPRLPVEH